MTDVAYNLNGAHDNPAYRISERIWLGGEMYEYVKFESNVAANAITTIDANGLATAATQSSTGRLGIVGYGVTASTNSPKYGWIKRVGRATCLASSGSAGSEVFLTTTAGTIAGTGTTRVPTARFVTAASGGTASIILFEAAAI